MAAQKRSKGMLPSDPNSWTEDEKKAVRAISIGCELEVFLSQKRKQQLLLKLEAQNLSRVHASVQDATFEPDLAELKQAIKASQAENSSKSVESREQVSQQSESLANQFANDLTQQLQNSQDGTAEQVTVATPPKGIAPGAVALQVQGVQAKAQNNQPAPCKQNFMVIHHPVAPQAAAVNNQHQQVLPKTQVIADFPADCSNASSLDRYLRDTVKNTIFLNKTLSRVKTLGQHMSSVTAGEEELKTQAKDMLSFRMARKDSLKEDMLLSYAHMQELLAQLEKQEREAETKAPTVDSEQGGASRGEIYNVATLAHEISIASEKAAAAAAGDMAPGYGRWNTLGG